jgi:hypothetical protein
MNQYGGFGVLFNDNVVLFESGDFGFSRESNLFGGGCPSMTPSISAAPSLTASSLAPSISAAPSSILEKGLINKESLIHIDGYDWRYFPRAITNRPEGSYSHHQTIPSNCTSISNQATGCVAIPSTHYEYLEWSGQLYVKPPKCDGKTCSLGIPLPPSSYLYHQGINVHKGYKGLNGLNGFDINISLTTDHGSVRVGITDVIVAADMNNDDFIDIIVGNNGGSIQDSSYARR